TLDLFQRPAQGKADAKEQLGGGIADSYYPGARVGRNCLRDDSRGVREVDDPRVRCNPLHQSGMLQSNRNGAVSHGKACGTGSFLAREATLEGRALVSGASGHAARTDAAN